MPLQFTKMHGLGNDYVYISLFDQSVSDPARLAPLISDRHRGVGSDGLILVGPPDDGVAADVRMQMFNADGSRAEMCGNGVRCVAKLAFERRWAHVNPVRIQTDRGVLTLDLFLDARENVEQVRVNMGPPILPAVEIPVKAANANAPVVDNDLVLPGGTALKMTCVSMGNPHAVIYVDDLTAVPLTEWGPQIERHARFPRRVNAHFVQVLRRDAVRMITWERGTGPTQACGTGACAVGVAGVLTTRTDRRITATLPGGDLTIEWDEASNHVFKTGPASEVFRGTWPT